MKICFFPWNVDGSGCYRAIFPMAYLGTAGHQATMPSFFMTDGAGNPITPMQSEGLLGKISPGMLTITFDFSSVPTDCDLYVFQMGSHSWILDWVQRIREINPSAKIVVDMDDDVHRIPAYNPAKLDPDHSPLNNRRNTVETLELADHAIYATQALRDFYGRWCDGTVLRNRLHWPMWEHLPPVYERRDWERFRVGYMGNAAFHGGDIELIAAPLRKWLLAHPDVEFVAAGDERIHDIIGVPESQRVTTSNSWFRELDLAYITSCFDVGLVPLVKNDFNACKSWLKGSEYNACGIPCIASQTEEYKLWVEEGENGFLAKYPRDFISHLDTLYADRDLLLQMGRSAYRMARASSLDKHIQGWVDTFEAVSNGDHSDRGRSREAASRM